MVKNDSHEGHVWYIKKNKICSTRTLPFVELQQENKIHQIHQANANGDCDVHNLNCHHTIYSEVLSSNNQFLKLPDYLIRTMLHLRVWYCRQLSPPFPIIVCLRKVSLRETVRNLVHLAAARFEEWNSFNNM